jgi:hypothetical protein
MKYNCRYCEWEYDGQFKNGVIVEHDSTHPENSIDSFIARHKENNDDIQKYCSHCGCTEDHEHTESEKARTVSDPYPEVIQ